MCAISNPPLCTSHLLALFCAFQFVGFANADSLLVCVCALPSPVVRHRRGANQWAQASVWAQRVSATQCCHSGVGFFYCRKPTAHFPIHRRHMCQVRRPVRKSHRQRVLAEFGGSRVTLAQSFCSAEFFIIQIFIFTVEKFTMPENFSLTIFIGFTCNGKDFMFHISPFFDVESLSDSSSTAVSGLLADFLFLTRAFDLCATTRRITYTTCILFARLFSQLVLTYDWH